MASNDVATALVSALLGGGAVGTISTIVRARIDARKADPEIDAIIIGGAEKAVTTMGLALQAAERRIAALEAENENLRAVVGSLRQEIDTLRGELAALRHHGKGHPA